MDLSKFKPSDWLMVGGGAGMLIFGLVLDWSSLGGESGDNVFDYFFPGGIAWFLIVAVGVLAMLNAAGSLPAAQPWGLILLGLAGLGALLMVLQIILGGKTYDFGVASVTVDRGIGMWLSALAAIAAVVGSVMSFQESGGNVKDLTDVGKLKSSFSGSSDQSSPPQSSPPPPPPAD